ncbi:hypothetical protein LZ31DRAFT_184528 [Colletotrichum somersetense]|nr:hypothetical protein LZ31DRAFT_184528 [Colletotrichum somersetense]
MREGRPREIRWSGKHQDCGALLAGPHHHRSSSSISVWSPVRVAGTLSTPDEGGMESYRYPSLWIMACFVTIHPRGRKHTLLNRRDGANLLSAPEQVWSIHGSAWLDHPYLIQARATSPVGRFGKRCRVLRVKGHTHMAGIADMPARVKLRCSAGTHATTRSPDVRIDDDDSFLGVRVRAMDGGLHLWRWANIKIMRGIPPFFPLFQLPYIHINVLAKWDATSDFRPFVARSGKKEKEKKFSQPIHVAELRLLFQPPTHQESVHPSLPTRLSRYSALEQAARYLHIYLGGVLGVSGG